MSVHKNVTVQDGSRAVSIGGRGAVGVFDLLVVSGIFSRHYRGESPMLLAFMGGLLVD